MVTKQIMCDRGVAGQPGENHRYGGKVDAAFFHPNHSRYTVGSIYRDVMAGSIFLSLTNDI